MSRGVFSLTHLPDSCMVQKYLSNIERFIAFPSACLSQLLPFWRYSLAEGLIAAFTCPTVGVVVLHSATVRATAGVRLVERSRLRVICRLGHLGACSMVKVYLSSIFQSTGSLSFICRPSFLQILRVPVQPLATKRVLRAPTVASGQSVKVSARAGVCSFSKTVTE